MRNASGSSVRKRETIVIPLAPDATSPADDGFLSDNEGMKAAPLHPQERERLLALESLQLLDTLPEQEFDEITALASMICQTPIALISLVDRDRQWFKSKHGLDAEGTARELAFCAHAILRDELLEVRDAQADRRFHGNPLVTGSLNVRFYAGIPIRDPRSRLPIGTLCVIDHKPRELTPEQLRALEALKNQLHRLLLLRSELKLKQEQRRHITEDRQRQEFILEGAGLGSWDWWLETNRVHFDRRWCEMLGLDHESTPQHLSTWDARVHPDDRAKAYADIKACLDGRTEVYENIHRLKHVNGDWVWILDRGRVSQRAPDGRPIRFTGTHFDITNYKERELISSEIQKMANIGGWELDLATDQLTWTEQTYKIHEVPLGTPVTREQGIGFYAAHEIERLLSQLQNSVAGEPMFETFEFIDAHGVRKWVEVSGEPIRGADGRVRRLRGTFQDVTQKVEAEQALEASRLKATHAAKLASLGEMSAGVAHEINNPLAVIHGSIPLLRRFLPGEASFQTKLDSMSRAVQRIAKIVNGLRKFSRSSDETDLRSHSVADIVREALVLIEGRSKRFATPVELVLQTEAQTLCDALEIEQVIVNLVNNGIDAVKDREERWVRVHLFRRDQELVLRVSDSGPGIPAEIERRLFEPFFTTKPVGEGVGLGLSICKGILDNHKASLVLNKDEAHTCFEVRFRISAEGYGTT